MKILMTDSKSIKKFNTFAELLQPVGILCSIIFSFVSHSILFIIIAIIFSASYAISSAVKLSNKKPEENTAVIEENDTLKELKNHAEQLENQFNKNVVNKLKIIPVLTEQLQSVINQTDEAAGGLIQAFMGISRRAKDQLKAVRELFGNNSEEVSGNNILSQTNENIQKIQSNFLTLTSYFDNTLKMISEVIEQLSEVDDFASDIVNIGKTTNILAVNASIEASHSGKFGAGFKIIASEIKELSDQSSTSIKKITDITRNLKSMVNSIQKELQTVKQQSVTIAGTTDELFSQTTEKIGESLQYTNERMKSIASDAESLSKEISKVVVSIQFQDITRQRIEHVISPLEMLNKELIETIDKMLKNESDFLQSGKKDLAETLMQQYTMESERDILKKFNENL